MKKLQTLFFALCLALLSGCTANADQFDAPAPIGEFNGTVEGKINWPHGTNHFLMVWCEKIIPDDGNPKTWEFLYSLPQGLKVNVTWNGVNPDQDQINWIQNSKIGDRYAFKLAPNWEKNGVRMTAIPTPLSAKVEARAPQNPAPAQNAGVTTQTTTDPFYTSLKFQELNALPAATFLMGNGTEKSAADALSLINQNGAGATSARFAIGGERFQEGVRMEIPRDPKDADIEYWWSFLRADAPAPVEGGDVQWLTFFARVLPGTAKNDEGRFYFAVKQEKDTAGTSISGQQAGTVGTSWKQFKMPFTARSGDKPRLEIYANYRKQTLEFGGFAWLNFGESLSLDRLPIVQVDLNYRGREAGAPWRKAALERIETIRKGPLKVTVLDKNGKPVSGATVKFQQTKSAFPFGSHVPSHMFPGNWPPTDGGGYSNTEFRHRSADGGKVGDDYRKVVRENFEIVTNGFGWRLWEDKDRFRPQVLQDMKRWDAMGLQVKNHVLLYPREDLLPDSIPKMSPTDAKKALFDYIDAVVPATHKDVAIYDVMNEPFSSLVYQLKLKDNPDAYFALQAELFNRVKKLAPGAKTVLNDAGQDTSDEALEKFLTWAQKVKDQSGKIEEYGVQAHVGVMAPPEEILKRFDRLSAGGQTLNISEFDVKIGEQKTPEIQSYEADVLRDYLILAFSHPKMTHFILWGFWDGDHWLGNGPLFNLDWTPKPAYSVWKDLVLTKWRTNANAQTDKDGTASIRGFKGDYELTVSHGGKTQTAQTSIGKNGVLTVKLP